MNKLPAQWCIKGCDKFEKYCLPTNVSGRLTGFYYYNYTPDLNLHSWNFDQGKTIRMEITFEDFEKFILKEEIMTKQDFTIEGSEALKKAFVEESGLTDNYLTPWNTNKYMGKRWNKKGFDAYVNKQDKHFILPSQWEEALEYVKEYFTEDEFKVGDWVVVTSLKHNNSHSSYPIGLVAQISKEHYHTQCYGTDNKDWWHWLELNGVLLDKSNAVTQQCLRMATPEEIEKAKIQPKSFKLGEFTAVVTKDKVEIAGRGSLTHDECIEWFEKEFVCNDTYSPLGEFTVVENTYTIDIGCVKNVPVKDIEILYKYLKTL